jgi:hypothetical protein
MASKGFVADGTIRVCRFVKPSSSTDFRVVEADANELTIGISQEGSRVAPLPSVTTDPPEAAQAGEALNVYSDIGMTVMLRIGAGGITRGLEMISDADGNGVAVGSTAATVYQVGARALETAVEGQLCRVEIHRYTKTIPA